MFLRASEMDVIFESLSIIYLMGCYLIDLSRSYINLVNDTMNLEWLNLKWIEE